MDRHTAQMCYSLTEIRRLVMSLEENQPPLCTKPVVGPLLNFVREGLWKLLGMRQLLGERNAQLLQLLSQLEIALPRVMQGGPDLSKFHFRQDTGDWDIFQEIFLLNEYRLPEQFGPQDVIIDIGMHIGSFAFAALSRGAGRLYGFEVEAANFAMAQRNLEPFGDRARIFRKAVWRSDRKGDVLFANGDLPENTGGNSVLWNLHGETLNTISLDDILEEATEGGRRRISLLKIDCEGSEYAILLTSKKLHMIDRIHGEFHVINEGNPANHVVPAVAQVPGIDCYTMTEIADCLRRAGFHVESHARGSQHLGLFFATHRQARAAAA